MRRACMDSSNCGRGDEILPGLGRQTYHDPAVLADLATSMRVAAISRTATDRTQHPHYHGDVLEVSDQVTFFVVTLLPARMVARRSNEKRSGGSREF